MRLAAFAVLALTAGCHCGGGGPDGGVGRVVEVSRFRTLIGPGGAVTEVPFTFETSELSALIPEDGGDRVIYPVGVGPGKVQFEGVPDGSFIVTVNGYNVVTAEDSLDLGLWGLGREEPALSDGGATVLQLDVTGLLGWQQFSDVLQITAEAPGYVGINTQAYSVAQPDAGATEGRFELQYLNACTTQRGGLAPLIEAADVATVTQLASAPIGDAGALELRTLVRAATLPSFAMTDHAVTAVAAAFTAPAVQEHFAIDFRQSVFDLHRPAVHASAVAISSSVTITVVPFTADAGFYTAAPDLAVLRPQELKSDVALAFDTGNPFPADWPKLYSARYSTQVNVQYPDGGSRVLTTTMVVQDLVSALDGGLIVPRVTPPIELRVEGNLAQARAQISRTPTLSWEPPVLGSPTSYGITIFHFSRVGNGPVIAVSEDSFFETTARSFKLPFGEVRPGEEYVFGITAFDSPGAHVTRAPFKGGLPFGSATALTALMRIDPTLMINP